MFQKYRLSKSSMPWTLFLQSFSRVCVRIDFIVFNKWTWVEWFMTSLIFYLFVVVLSRISKWGDSQHMFLLYAIFYFCFTLRFHDEFCLKCVRNTGCQSLPCHELSSCKILQEFVLGYILLYSTSKYELSDLWLLSYFICLLWFCHGLPKGEIVKTYVIWC